MLNLDERYHSYLDGSKKMRIDGNDERACAQRPLILEVLDEQFELAFRSHGLSSQIRINETRCTYYAVLTCQVKVCLCVSHTGALRQCRLY